MPYSHDPTVYRLDRKGVVRFIHRGEHSKKVMKKLKAALAGLKSAAAAGTQ